MCFGITVLESDIIARVKPRVVLKVRNSVQLKSIHFSNDARYL